MTSARITESAGAWISSLFGVGIEVIPFQPMTVARRPPSDIRMNGKAAWNLWRIRDVVKGAIVRNPPIRVTKIPKEQRIKQKKCRSSWSIDYRFWRFMVLFLEVTWASTREDSGTSRIIWRFLGVSGTPSKWARINGIDTTRSPGRISRKMKKASKLIRDSRDLREESPKGFGKERRKGIRDIRKCWG